VGEPRSLHGGSIQTQAQTQKRPDNVTVVRPLFIFSGTAVLQRLLDQRDQIFDCEAEVFCQYISGGAGSLASAQPENHAFGSNAESFCQYISAALILQRLLD
jgi:hypothetical protein